MADFTCVTCKGVFPPQLQADSTFTCPTCHQVYAVSDNGDGRKRARPITPEPTIESVNFSDNMEVIEQATGLGSVVRVLQYKRLGGSQSLNVGRMLYDAYRAGMKLKQVCISINDSAVYLESGALQYMKGRIELDTSGGGLGGFAKGFATSMLTSEASVKPLYRGVGDIYLEPSFGHFMIVPLMNDKVVVDKGLFYACERSIQVGVEMQKHFSAGAAGGEGWFQTKLEGSGWCVLNVPVPPNEIIRLQLNGEKLSVDGSFALLRKGDIDFKVEKSTRSMFGSAVSGEGMLQTFSGTGEVWLAPTGAVYDRIYALTSGITSVTTR